MTVSRTFYGAINLDGWWEDPRHDASYRTVVGFVSILTEDDLGFKIRTVGNANYVVRVEGRSGERVDFPGCKVFGFTEFPVEIEPGDLPFEIPVPPNNVYVVP